MRVRRCSVVARDDARGRGVDPSDKSAGEHMSSSVVTREFCHGVFGHCARFAHTTERTLFRTRRCEGARTSQRNSVRELFVKSV